MSYPLRDDFDAGSIKQGIQIADVNYDGAKDIILDLGIVGKKHDSICFVFDTALGEYTALDGFAELWTTFYLPSQHAFLEEPMPMSSPLKYKKYEVQNNKLVHIASLYLQPTESGDFYTEEHLVDGTWVTVKESVKENEINFYEWGADIGLGP